MVGIGGVEQGSARMVYPISKAQRVGGELTVESLVGKGLPAVLGVDFRDPSLRSG